MQNQWYIARDGKQYGPVTDSDLAHLVQNRELLDGDYLWRQGFDNWLPAGQVAEVRDLATQGAGAPGGQTGANPAGANPAGGHQGGGTQGPINGQMGGQFQNQQDPRINPQDVRHAENRVVDQRAAEQAQRDGHFAQNGAGAERPDGRYDSGSQTGMYAGGQGNHPAYQQGGDPYATDARDGAHARQDGAPEGEMQADQHSSHLNSAQLNSGQLNSGHLKGSALAEINENQRALKQTGAEHDPRYDVQELVEDTEFHDASAQSGAFFKNDRDMHDAGGADQPASFDQSAYDTETNDLPSSFSARGDRGGVDVRSTMGVGKRDPRDAEMSTEGMSSRKASSLSSSGISWPLGLGIGVAALLILMVGATFAIPFIVPPETVKRQISSALKKETGRDVSFKGKISYRFFPSFGVDLNNIVIHNPASIKGPDFLSLGRLQADLKILPLLSKRVEVNRIVLHRPEIALIKNGQGETNYEFKSASARTLKRNLPSFKVAQVETLDTSDIIARTLEKLEKEEAEKEKADNQDTSNEPPSDETKTPAEVTTADPKGPDVDEGIATQKTGSAGVADIQVGEIEIVNGAVKLIDQKTNSETDISAINMTLQAPSADQNVSAKGTLRYLEDRIAVEAQLATLGTLLKGEPIDSSIRINSDRFEGKYDGKLRLGEKIEFKGDADIQTYSLQKLLNWVGVDVPKQGYGGAYIRGKLEGNPNVMVLNSATIKMDNSVLIGSLRVRPDSPRPKIEAKLKSDLLDLSPYLAQQNEIKRGAIDNAGPRKTALAAWNSAKVDLSFLNGFDGFVQVQAARLVIKKHQIDQANFAVKVVAGVMTAQAPDFKLYGGSGSLNMSINASKPRPTLKGKIGLSKIRIKPLLQNTAEFAWLSGVGDIDLDITSAGNTEQEMISALNGTGKIAVSDGAIEGVNIPGMLRNLQQGKLFAPSGKPTEKTDFSDLTASLLIDKGIVQNKDLTMKGPLLRLTGEGVVNLPAEQIDYGLQPKLVNSLAGQGGVASLAGINIPIRVKGPLSNPKFTPDADGLLKNNGAAIEDTVDSVKKVVKDLKKKKISSEEMKGLLNGIIDGNQENGNVLKNILQ